jgi:hypothetical protein
MELKPLNMSIEKSLITQIKIQAIKEGRTVSVIAAELFGEYLRNIKTKEK